MKKYNILLVIICFLFSLSVQSQTVVVCGGQYAKRYHATKSCNGLNNCKGGLYEKKLQEATDMGRTPCQICYSANSSETKINAPNYNTTKESSSTQCTGTTKAGNRCKRMTTNANGRCYQH